MARPRKPSAMLELEGAFRKNPARKRARESEPVPRGPLGDPPASLSKPEKAAWHEIATHLPPGVGTDADRLAFEVICRLAARMREDGIGGRHGLAVGELAQMNVMLSRFGLTPADRPKIVVPKPKDETNPFAEIANEASPAARRLN